MSTMSESLWAQGFNTSLHWAAEGKAGKCMREIFAHIYRRYGNAAHYSELMKKVVNAETKARAHHPPLQSVLGLPRP